MSSSVAAWAHRGGVQRPLPVWCSRMGDLAAFLVGHCYRRGGIRLPGSATVFSVVAASWSGGVDMSAVSGGAGHQAGVHRRGDFHAGGPPHGVCRRFGWSPARLVFRRRSGPGWRWCLNPGPGTGPLGRACGALICSFWRALVLVAATACAGGLFGGCFRRRCLALPPVPWWPHSGRSAFRRGGAGVWGGAAPRR